MTTRKIGAILCSALFAAALAAGRSAAMDQEFYVNTYRSIGTVSARGQRSAAMGRTGAGLADGAASLGVNPAGLGAFTGYAVEGGLGIDWLDDGADSTDQTTFQLGGAASLETWRPSGKPNQSVGALIQVQGFSGAGGVGMERKQTGLAGGYGIHLLEDLVAGVSVALFDGDWKAPGNAAPFERAFTGGEFKLGGIYRVSDQMTVGAAAGYSTGSFNEKILNVALGRSGSGNLNRWGLQAGVGYQLYDETLLAGDLWYDSLRTEASDWLDERNRAWGLSMGIEQQVLPDTLALRGGLYYDKTKYSSSGLVNLFGAAPGDFSQGRFGFTAGAAVKLYSFDIGYSLDVNTRGDVKNLLDVSAEW